MDKREYTWMLGYMEPLSIYLNAVSIYEVLLKLLGLACHWQAIWNYYLKDIESRPYCKGVSVLRVSNQVLISLIWDFSRRHPSRMPGDMFEDDLVAFWEDLGNMSMYSQARNSGHVITRGYSSNFLEIARKQSKLVPGIFGWAARTWEIYELLSRREVTQGSTS